ncbi:MAG: alpha/beta fold hydrolase [Blastocatellia bacterium]|nr:alpha/beta fold hydrolase [Blastocatellia bacterium]
MPYISANSTELFYTEFGDSQNPTIVFTHSLLCDGEMFNDLIERLSSQFHIINIDQHGHGESGYPEAFSLEDMVADYIKVLDQLGLNLVHWAGLSMGGMVGMRLALAYPHRIKSLILMNTSAQTPKEEHLENQLALANAIREGSAASVVDAILPFFFCQTTYYHQPDLVDKYRRKFSSYRNTEGIYQAAMAVFYRSDISEKIREIKLPTLVIVGQEDVATPVEESEFIVSRIDGAVLKVLENTGHMSATEKPEEVAAIIERFFNSN